jgi:hypothetical protein
VLGDQFAHPGVNSEEAPRCSFPRRSHDDATIERHKAPIALSNDSIAGVGSAWIDSEDNHSAIVCTSPDAV